MPSSTRLVPPNPSSVARPGLVRAVVLVAVVAMSSALGALSLEGAADAGTVPVAQATILTTDLSHALLAGGSETTYAVGVPSGAACPQDTEHHGYHVFSYLVPQGHSASDVSFKTGVPSRWYGFIADGAYYGAINTAPDTGALQALPTTFTWTRLTPKILFARGHAVAVWEGGIACADVHGKVTNAWNVSVTFRRDARDPHGFTWRVAGETSAHARRHRSWVGPVALAAGIALLVVGAGNVALDRWRRRAQPDPGPRP